MQKIFRKYTVMIITSAILLILIINSLFSMLLIKSQQLRAFNTKLDQIITTLEDNQVAETSINRTMGREYLTRAKAAAYAIKRDPSILTDTDELQQLSSLLSVDELHITDENGIIAYSSIPDYVGVDFHNDEQTRKFLSILDSDENAYVIQSAQPDSTSGRLMRYVGVARLDQTGIVQIGLTPTRLLEAQNQNTYSNIFSTLTTDIGEEFFAIDCKTKLIVGHSDGIEQEGAKHDIPFDRLRQCQEGAFLKTESSGFIYCVTRQYEDILICASIPAGILFRTLLRNVLITFLCLIIVEVIILILLNYLVKQKVILGIHAILDDLTQITNGNMDTIVRVGGNPEFENLSKGINTMVHSIFHTSDRITKIIEMSEIPMAVFEYQNETDHLFVTFGLKKLLHLSENDTQQLFASPAHFYQRIQEIMKNPAPGEKDIFQIAEGSFIRIHLALEPSGYLGVITDATRDVGEKQRMLYENIHDQLTGLFCYQYFKEHSSRLLENMHPGKLCACVMLDLDLFKEINDTYGHDTGDRYLQQFASLLKMLPENNSLVTRRSGDEFCIFTFYYNDPDQIRKYMERFTSLLKSNPFVFPDGTHRVIGVSGGYAWTSHSDIEISALMKQADDALYESKWNRKGTFMEYHS